MLRELTISLLFFLLRHKLLDKMIRQFFCVGILVALANIFHLRRWLFCTQLAKHDRAFRATFIKRCNGPFAANGHMVQNPPCWRASYALGHPQQRKCKFVLMKSLCSGCPSGQLALQHGGFCTM